MTQNKETNPTMTDNWDSDADEGFGFEVVENLKDTEEEDFGFEVIENLTDTEEK